MSDYLNMSDEEMLNATPPTAEESATNTPQEPEQVEETVVESTEQEQEVSTEDANKELEPESTEKPSDEDEAEQASDESVENKKVEVEPTPEKEATPSINYEEEYKKLLAPFKANGRDIEIKTVDDAITLMQMGANYNKKMAALKPNLKILKLLQNNGILDEGKLSYLIDLDKKNPGAISKLVKDSGIDPMDIDTEKAGEYRTETRSVDEREIALDNVLDEIQDSPTYNRTLNIIGKDWDRSSRNILSDNPQLIKIINSHVEQGIFDQISDEVEREKMLGRLNGLSDLEAYRQVGDAIQARGGFNVLSDQQAKPKAGNVIATAKPNKPDPEKLKDKKRAASSTTSSPSKSGDEEFDPLNLSDEEFDKYAKTRYK